MVIEAPDLEWPARDADERTMLEGYLDAYRALAVRKVAGLDRAQLSIALPPSTMTLAGLLKHLAVVEDDWFHSDLAGDELPEPWASVAPELAADWSGRPRATTHQINCSTCSRLPVVARGVPAPRSTRWTRCP